MMGAADERHARMYDIEYTETARTDLQWFKKHEQNVIVAGIDKRLRSEPTTENRNRKELRHNLIAAWELRIGDFRVLYDVDVQVRIVAIKRIGEKRGNTLYLRGQREEL